MSKIIFIDGMNAIHRANISFGKRSEHLTNFVTFNFFRSLRLTIETFKPDVCYFVLEGKPKFRYDILPEYKANRVKKTEEAKEKSNSFYDEAARIIDLLNYLPIIKAKATHYECDDVISSLCHHNKNNELVIITNDTDYIQLLQGGFLNLKIYAPIKKIFFSAPEYNYVKWKSLSGDKSDNIPSLMSDAKAKRVIANEELMNAFILNEENKRNLTRNESLINFRLIADEDIKISEKGNSFNLLKQEFESLHFQTIIADKYWDNFVETFSCLLPKKEKSCCEYCSLDEASCLFCNK
jgi:hypothetical protein